MNRKMKIALTFTTILAIIIVLLLPLLKKLAPLPTAPGQNASDQLRPERLILMPPDQLVKLIAPRPNTTVLDIGAGFGYFTFPLARAIGEKGTVFATDTDPKSVEYLTSKVRREGLKNVVPVRVKAAGLDEFYTQHTFDMILAADVLPVINSPVTFFDQLRPMLAVETGRLWVVQGVLAPDFTVTEFGDKLTLRSALNTPEVTTIILSRFREYVRQQFTAGKGLDATFTEVTVAELNRLLDDTTLLSHIQKTREVHLNQREEKLRQELVRVIEREGGMNAETVARKPAARVALHLLNRLVIQDLLGTKAWEKAFSLDNLDWEQWEPLVNQLVTGQDYASILRKAGYELVQQHQALLYHYVWEFKRTR